MKNSITIYNNVSCRMTPKLIGASLVEFEAVMVFPEIRVPVP